VVATRTSKPALKPEAWCYASGFAAAQEGRLLTHRATLDLLSLGGLEELLGRVRQTFLFGDLAETLEPFELAESMQACFAVAVRRTAQASPIPAVADVFLLPVEWQSFRGYLRQKALGLERAPVPGAAIPDATWDQCWSSADQEPPLDGFAAAAVGVRASISQTGSDLKIQNSGLFGILRSDPHRLDAITSVHEAHDVLRAARQTESPDIASWVETWLRLRLALALLRCRLSHWDELPPRTIPADLGNVGASGPLAPSVTGEPLVTTAGSERRDWRPTFAGLGLASAPAVPEDDPLRATTIERLIDDRLTELTHAGRGVAFGPELVFAFLWGLRCEALNLRLIVTGVAARLPRESIAKDIRQTYV
jgi:hypothetical protein